MTPVIRDKASMIKGMLSVLGEGDINISQTMEIQKSLVDSRWGDRDSPTQIMFANVHIEKTVKIAIQLLDEIIDYKEPVIEAQPVLDDMLTDVCSLAYGQGRSWAWLRDEVIRHYAMTAERHHKTMDGAAASIEMDRTTFKKYLI